MFDTPPFTPTGGFTEGSANKTLGSQLRAAWLTYVAAQFPNALDAINGGYYQLVTANIALSSDSRGFVLNFPHVSHKIELRGHVSFAVTNDANYATGQGSFVSNVASTFSGTVAIDGTATFSNVVAFNGNPGTTVTTSANVTSIFNGPTTINYPVTLNQPIVQTGPDGFVSPSNESISGPSANFNVDCLKNCVLIAAQTANVKGILTYASGGLPRIVRVVSRAMSPGFKIDFEFVAFPGTTIATFPTTGSRAWVDFYYNGLTWEVCAYGGGTVVY